MGVYIIYVSFNIKRGFYYLGGSFWNYVGIYGYMYLLILKEAFIIWGIQRIMYTYIYIFVSFNIKRGFYYLGGSFEDVFLFIPNLHNVLNKINIISAAAGLWGINVSDDYFYVRGG